MQKFINKHKQNSIVFSFNVKFRCKLRKRCLTILSKEKGLSYEQINDRFILPSSCIINLPTTLSMCRKWSMLSVNVFSNSLITRNNWVLGIVRVLSSEAYSFKVRNCLCCAPSLLVNLSWQFLQNLQAEGHKICKVKEDIRFCQLHIKIWYRRSEL